MNRVSEPNIDSAEVEKFSSAAANWWDPESEFRPLHQINPLRLDYIESHSPVEGKRILDVGCGGGILSESLAQHGAEVTGIDVSVKALDVARIHLLESKLKVDYILTTVEEFASRNINKFDIITCMELLEHVPDPMSVVESCANLLNVGGDMYFSTLNRNPKSWLFGIVGAEYILSLIPRGTHQYAKFVKPSELNHWCQQHGVSIHDITGLHYNPFTKHFKLGPGVDVNYMVHCKRI